MKTVLLICFLLLSQMIFAQNKELLQKQLIQILVDYPNQFKNLEKDFKLKFRISGTADSGIVLGTGTKVFISSPLDTPGSETDVKKLFEKWKFLMNEIDFNGVKMIGSDCSSDGTFKTFCYEWKFDNNRKDLDKKYFQFTILVQAIRIENDYGASLLIGGLE